MYTCVKWWYLQMFFSFFQNFDFLGCSGVKGQNMARNDKKFCLSRFISQESYIIRLPFMVHFCEIISPAVSGLFWFFFHFFKILVFWVVKGVKGQKMVQNDKKLCLSRSISHEPHTSYDFHFSYTCVMWQYLQVFFAIFQNFDFPGC